MPPARRPIRRPWLFLGAGLLVLYGLVNWLIGSLDSLGRSIMPGLGVTQSADRTIIDVPLKSGTEGQIFRIDHSLLVSFGDDFSSPQNELRIRGRLCDQAGTWTIVSLQERRTDCRRTIFITYNRWRGDQPYDPFRQDQLAVTTASPSPYPRLTAHTYHVTGRPDLTGRLLVGTSLVSNVPDVRLGCLPTRDRHGTPSPEQDVCLADAAHAGGHITYNMRRLELPDWATLDLSVRRWLCAHFVQPEPGCPVAGAGDPPR